MVESQRSPSFLETVLRSQAHAPTAITIFGSRDSRVGSLERFDHVRIHDSGDYNSVRVARRRDELHAEARHVENDV